MHTIVVFTRRTLHEAVLSAWLADALGRGEKVLVLRAPGEDASMLDRSLAAVGLDPSGGRVGSAGGARHRPLACGIRW